MCKREIERLCSVICEFKSIRDYCESKVDVNGVTKFVTDVDIIETDSETVISVDIKKFPNSISLEVEFINCKSFSYVKGTIGKPEVRSDDLTISSRVTFHQIKDIADIGHCVAELEKLNKLCLMYVSSY